MRILTCYNNIMHPGIAKLVSRLVWDQETVRSSRTTRTKPPLKSLISEGFFLFFVYCGAAPCRSDRHAQRGKTVSNLHLTFCQKRL